MKNFSKNKKKPQIFRNNISLTDKFVLINGFTIININVSDFTIAKETKLQRCTARLLFYLNLIQLI